MRLDGFFDILNPVKAIYTAPYSPGWFGAQHQGKEDAKATQQAIHDVSGGYEDELARTKAIALEALSEQAHKYLVIGGVALALSVPLVFVLIKRAKAR